MRNLSLHRNITIEDVLLSNLTNCFIITESSTSNLTKLFVFNEDLEVYQLNITDNATFQNIFIQDLSQFNDEPTLTAKVAGCNYIHNVLYVILNTGYLVSIVVNGESEDNETIGQSLKVGSTKIASWSPDFERTVLVNFEDKLFILNIINFDFEKINEISLQNASEEQNQFVSVGWGNVETQFRGSEGKFTKFVSKEVVNDDVVDDNVHVCWKQNGTAFAVSYICQAERRRKIKIFSQDGNLLNVTKDISSLQSPADWCPSRNLIFCPQTLPNKQVICFLEENALRHGEFEIFKDTKVKELLWNTNGTILACYGVCNDHEFIALWMMNNYKWYMKQNLLFNQPIIYVQWDFLSPNKLHIILKSGVYRSYEWTQLVNESCKCGGENNKAIVSVVNGHQLGITPYAIVNQPPSMPFKSYDLSPCKINAVVFPENSFGKNDELDGNSMILYLDNDCLRLLKYNDEVSTDFRFRLKKEPIHFSTPSELSAFVWILPNTLYFGWCRTDHHYFCVSRLDIDNKTVVVDKTFKMNSSILSSCCYHKDVIVLLDNGTLYLYREESLRPMEIFFFEPCICLQILNENTLMALSENRNLYVNNFIKFRDVISFYWKPPFIILLKMDSRLLISKVNFSEKQASFDEVLSRGIEPKSYLLTVVDDRVLLETERGNLEIIVPRPFSIFKMEHKLRNAEYFEVFKMLRKQRINLNVLYDHDPDSFMNNIEDIISDVSDPMYLLNFITELEDHDVATAMFPWKYGSIARNTPNKVEMICEKFCAVIEKTNDPKLIIPLIAALVKQNKLAEAAKYAIELNEVQTLNHLCDPVAVYKAAMGSFDLVHALHIIQNSKLDPSEYLPFIHELQTLEENYRKFKICDYLEDYPTALTHLANCTEDEKFAECVEYMRKHQLFRTAIEVFNAKRCESDHLQARYVRILTSIAEFHFLNQCFFDAGILFEKANLNDRAFKCFLSSGDWFSAISIAKCMYTETERILEASREVYDMLVRQRKYEDAGFIAYHFISDCKLAVDAYLTAKKFCCAINAAKGLKSDSTISQIIRPILVDEAKSFIYQQKNKLTVVIAYQERLNEIRRMKKNLDKHNEDDRQSVVSSSDSSDASSISSSDSKASTTSASAKRARRRERRLWNLKPGNRREEPSLLNAIRQIVIQYENDYKEMIPDLMKALVKTDELILARELKTSYVEFSTLLKLIVDKIWTAADLPEDGAGFQDILVSCPPDITPLKNDLIIINYK